MCCGFENPAIERDRERTLAGLIKRMTRTPIVLGLLACTAACGNNSNGNGGLPSTSTTTTTSPALTSAAASSGGASAPSASAGIPSAASTFSGAAPTATAPGSSSATGTGSSSAGAPASGEPTAPMPSGEGASSASSAEPDGGAAGTVPSGAVPSGAVPSGAIPSASSSSGGLVPSSCVGGVVPAADPTKAGPFQVSADKGVGPFAGKLPDPIYGDEQQRFNVYRPANLAQSEYCHPILIWANGFQDNPEQNPPDCIVDSNADRWCGQYLPLMNHLASHGFVVVASLSTATADGDPLPTIVGLDWILEQAEDPSSQYYHRLDTENIGQLGHSYGGMSTCMSASEPRYKALATICGTRALEGVHTPMLFFCGGMDDLVECAGVHDTFATVTDQPAFFLNERNADHGSWVYQGPGGVSLSASAAWFRAHLMNDSASRAYFYGANCKFCSDNRVEAEQNALMLP